MAKLPVTTGSPVLRTDFSDQAAWESISDEIQRPSAEGFEAHVEFIDDRAFDGLSKQQLLAAVPKDYPHTFIVIVDRKALSDDEHPLLVMNLFDGLGSEVGEEFRTVPSEIQAIENNLSIANLDFAEFAEAVDGSGVFRGF
jgi:hypothetical protein